MWRSENRWQHTIKQCVYKRERERIKKRIVSHNPNTNKIHSRNAHINSMHRVILSLGVLWVHEHEYTTNVCPYCLCIVWCAAYLWVIVSVYVCMICDVFVCVCECACDCMCPPYSPTTNIRLHTTILCGCCCCCIIHCNQWINESCQNAEKIFLRLPVQIRYDRRTVSVCSNTRVTCVSKEQFSIFQYYFFFYCVVKLCRAQCVYSSDFVQQEIYPSTVLHSCFSTEPTENKKLQNKNRSHYLSEEEFWVDLLSKYIHWTWFRVIV